MGILGGAGGCAAPAPPAATTAPAVELHLVDHERLLAEVAARKGRVVVLDCWSTSCPPCVREFPGLVALARSHPAEVSCLSLALDYDGRGAPEDAAPTVRGFLERVGAGGVFNMLAREEADIMYRKLRLVSVPAVYVWRADGSLAVRFDDDHASRVLGRPFTYDDVAVVVRDLLAGEAL